jgi:antitoxin CptB
MSETNQDSPEQIKFNRLFWHSRRGMLELDVLLVPFLKEAYKSLEPADQERYERLLECEDTELFQWFMQKSVPEDPDHARMVRMILDRVQPD